MPRSQTNLDFCIFDESADFKVCEVITVTVKVYAFH